jgi:hypothetical protein
MPLVEVIFFGAFTAPLAVDLASGLAVTLPFAFATGLATGLAGFFTTGFATTFLVAAFTTGFVVLAGVLVAGLTVFTKDFATGFLTIGLALATATFDLAGASLVVEDLIVFPLIGALVALVFDFALGATAFFDAAAAEVLVVFEAMRTFSLLEVDRYEISGITKTHVKSKEMTGSFFDYATKFRLYGSTEPNGYYLVIGTSKVLEVFPKSCLLEQLFAFRW